MMNPWLAIAIVLAALGGILVFESAGSVRVHNNLLGRLL